MRDPRALIDTNTLAASLGDPSLRVFDCTTYLEPTPAGSTERGFTAGVWRKRY